MKVTEESENTATAEMKTIKGRKIKQRNLVRHKKAVGNEKTDS